MKIAFNGTQISNQMDGSTRVTRSLFQQLNEIRGSHEIILTSYGRQQQDQYPLRKYCEEHFDDYFEMMKVKKFFGNCDYDLFHSPHPFHVSNGIPYTPIFLANCATVLTVLDLILYKNLCQSSDESCKIFQKQMDLSCQWADKIIAISENTKNDIVKEIGVDPERIEVIYCGLDEKFLEPCTREEIDNVKEKFGIKEDYIFYLCNKFPHKNLKGLIRGFSEIVKNTDIKEILVLSGKVVDSNEESEITKLIHELGIIDRIKFIGHLEESDVVPFYSGAKLLAYPSFYEGFGIPPLEAMACGVPVVASNISSIPEIVGDAAFLVDPYSVDSIAHGLITVLREEDVRSSLIEKGRSRVERFSWKESASRTLKLYERTYEDYLIRGKRFPLEPQFLSFFEQYVDFIK